MPLRVWNGSAFTTAITARVWNGSSWVNAKSAKVWNGSSWVNFLSSVSIEGVTDVSTASGFETAQAALTYYINSNGTVYVENYTSEGGFNNIFTPYSSTWLTGGANSDISVRATVLSSSGGSPFGTFNQWDSISIGGVLSWGISAGAVTNFGQVTDSTSATFRIELAYTADTSKILDSAVIDFTAQAVAFT